jgi:hypothetical protein
MRSNSTYLTILLACFSCSLTTLAHADVSFSLSSSVNLTQLKVGNTVTVNVTLAGVTSPQEIVDAAAQVAIAEALFLGSNVTPGSIVPNNGADFFGDAFPDLIDGAFQNTGAATADHITFDGVLYSFQLTALAPGSGELQIGFHAAGAFDPDNPNAPISLDSSLGAPLPFGISVPEPHSFLLAATGGLVAAWMIRNRRRTAIRPA